ncbi:MAG: universal stress protein [Thaumarchaeota archaeon]|nr:universal stress protein [Nitrososphaerota archaeon]
MATDGSENSDYSLNVAMKIAEKYSSHIDLIYVRQPQGNIPSSAPLIDPVIGGTSVLIPSQGDNARGTDAAATRKKTVDLLERRLNIIRDRNFESEAILVESPDISGEILKASRTRNYDLVVLGSRGMSGLKSLLMGSVSTKVAKEAKCSVLIMKRRIEGVFKILLGFDGSPESRKALEFLLDFGKKMKAEVDPLSVVNIPMAPEGIVGADVDRWEKEMKELADEAADLLRSSGITSTGKVSNYVDVARALSDEAEKGAYDLIVVGNRGLGKLRSLFLGSVASGVANSAKTNVLIVR